MNYASQKKFFESAYATGTDTWTHIPNKLSALEHVRALPKDSLILDVGSGRGLWPFSLAELGYKVIGIDYAKSVVEKNNSEVKFRGLAGRIRFMEADALDIPFEDASFDAVTDFGLLQHLDPSDWHTYVTELSRVLKPGGLLMLVALSRETKVFLNWTPHVSPEGKFERDGVTYYFFTKEEVRDIFSAQFDTVSQSLEHVEQDATYFVTSIFKKK